MLRVGAGQPLGKQVKRFYAASQIKLPLLTVSILNSLLRIENRYRPRIFAGWILRAERVLLLDSIRFNRRQFFRNVRVRQLHSHRFLVLCKRCPINISTRIDVFVSSNIMQLKLPVNPAAVSNSANINNKATYLIATIVLRFHSKLESISE